MAIILMAITALGMITGKILLILGVQSLVQRSLVGLGISYISFFVFIRFWLFYIWPDSKNAKIRSKKKFSESVENKSNQANVQGVDFSGLPSPEDFANHASADSLPEGFSDIGGKFSGGGASGDFSSSSPSSDFSLGSVDIDDAGEGIIVLAFGVLLAVIFGGAIYLVVEAPMILSEVAFQALLCGGLIRSAQSLNESHWIVSVLKASWIPFVLILAVMLIFTWVSELYCPNAIRFQDVIRGCVIPWFD